MAADDADKARERSHERAERVLAGDGDLWRRVATGWPFLDSAARLSV